MVASFFWAVQFLTRLPVPLKRKPSPSEMRWSTAFYPLVGLLIGLALAGIFRLLSGPLGAQPAILTALTAGVLLSGGLHEDGLADCADAFGAGGAKERMLEIMRDSSIGSYGAISLVLLFLFRYVLLAGLSGPSVEAGLLLAHTGGRSAAPVLGRLFPAARQSGLGSSFLKSVGLAQILPGLLTLCAAGYWVAGIRFAWILLPGFVAALLFSLYSWKRVGGLTGDVLGGSVVIFEVATYGALAWQGAVA